jgi:hypothetical protein
VTDEKVAGTRLTMLLVAKARHIAQHAFRQGRLLVIAETEGGRGRLARLASTTTTRAGSNTGSTAVGAINALGSTVSQTPVASLRAASGLTSCSLQVGVELAHLTSDRQIAASL